MIRIAYIGSEQTTNHTFSKIEVRKLVYEQENVFSSEDALVFLSNHQTEINECDGILISSGSHIDFGVYLTLHIRLNQDWNLDTKPVVLLSDDEIESFNRRRLEGKSAFISTDDTKFMSTNEWHPQDMIEEHFTEYNYLSSSLEINMNQFYAVPLNNRHQITNEWGAYKLAYTARLFNLLPIIEEKQPASKTIYFKYLKRKMLENSSNTEGISTPSQSVSTIKYLLIDDNHDKGWSSVFDAIFQQVDTQLGIVAYQNIAQINENITIAITEIIAEIEDKKYQGVLLDLRLTNEDDKPDKGNTEILNFSGGKILKALKDKYPFLPVIMVTASNKAWNMQQLLDAGADGYFIKEDPESNPSEDISKSSYEAFKKLIEESRKKYKALEPFWNYIAEIEDGNLIEERNENGVTKVEERIKERLRMFFGLLKRSFEDSKYNEQFHYSDMKLAFMTLWSCLNDIQYIYYDKNSTTGINVRQFLITHFSLQSNFQSLTYLINNKLKTKIKEDHNSQTFSIGISDEDGNKMEQNIGKQIAFLLYGFCSSDNDLNKRTSLLKALYEQKKKRNHLYLTHGKEEGNFFQKLEKENIEITLTDCAQLFEIVYFLLRGCYISVQI